MLPKKCLDRHYFFLLLSRHCSDVHPTCSITVPVGDELDEIHINLTRCVSHCIMAIKGLASTTISEGSSTENHKEFNDKNIVKILLGHIKANTIADPIIHSDEVVYSLPGNSLEE